jgi:hypothetical protein
MPRAITSTPTSVDQSVALILNILAIFWMFYHTSGRSVYPLHAVFANSASGSAEATT